MASVVAVKSVVAPVFSCGVNDPISCMCLDQKGRFMAFGSLSGAVRLVFHHGRNPDKVEENLNAMELGQGIQSESPEYAIIVLTRRSEEAIHSLFIDENDFLFATVGDKKVKVWNLHNLQSMDPPAAGAQAHTLEFSRPHNYMLCSTSYTLQDRYCIAICASNHQFLHLMTFDPNPNEARTPFEEDTQLKLYQSKLAFGLPRHAYPCSFTKNLICWIEGSDKSKWRVSIWNWRRREQVWSKEYPIKRFGSVTPTGFHIQGNYVVSIHNRTEIHVNNFSDSSQSEIVLKKHRRGIAALYVGNAQEEPNLNYPEEQLNMQIEQLLIVSLGIDGKLIVWKNCKLQHEIQLPKLMSRFDLDIPYWVTTGHDAKEIYFNDDSGLHVVHCE